MKSTISVIISVFLVVFHTYQCGYVVEKVEVDLSSNPRVFTADEIKKYDGSDENLPIYMAIKGVVFDLSTGRDFYGKDAPYNALVGKDATRGVAKMSLEPEDLVADVSDLADDLLKSLDTNFRDTYMRKYPVVGYMDYLVEQTKQEKKTPRDDL